MRKFTSIILLIMFIYTSDGYYLYFKYLQHNLHQEIKNEIKKGVKEKDLSIIIIPLNEEKEILWLKNDKEFKYKGAMFDVVRTEIKGQKKYYYCIKDVKEGQLIISFVKNNRRKSNNLWKLKRKISNKYFSEKFSLQANISKPDFYFKEYNQHYKSKYFDVASPPPKF